MNKFNNSKATPSKTTNSKNGINLDYNSEYGDGDIPNIDKPRYSNTDSEDYEDLDFFEDFE